MSYRHDSSNAPKPRATRLPFYGREISPRYIEDQEPLSYRRDLEPYSHNLNALSTTEHGVIEHEHPTLYRTNSSMTWVRALSPQHHGDTPSMISCYDVERNYAQRLNYERDVFIEEVPQHMVSQGHYSLKRSSLDYEGRRYVRDARVEAVPTTLLSGGRRHHDLPHYSNYEPEAIRPYAHVRRSPPREEQGYHARPHSRNYERDALEYRPRERRLPPRQKHEHHTRGSRHNYPTLISDDRDTKKRPRESPPRQKHEHHSKGSGYNPTISSAERYTKEHRPRERRSSPREKYDNHTRDSGYNSSRDHKRKEDHPRIDDQPKQHVLNGLETSTNAQDGSNSKRTNKMKPSTNFTNVDACPELDTKEKVVEQERKETVAKQEEPSIHHGTEAIYTPGMYTPTPSSEELARDLPRDKGDAEGAKENNDIPDGRSSGHNIKLMGGLNSDRPSNEGSSRCYFRLLYDKKIICRTECRNPPIELSLSWNLDIVKGISRESLAKLPQFSISPSFEDARQNFEWIKFLTHLHDSGRIAIEECDGVKLYIFPPEDSNPEKRKDGLYFDHALVAYHVKEGHDTSERSNKATSVPLGDTRVKGSSSSEKGVCSALLKSPKAVNSSPRFHEKKFDLTERNFVRTDPSYLKTLGQAHSGWNFGAIAELIDNSKDANASRIDIAVEAIYDRAADCEIPMLSIIDDGDGMNHQDILRMVSFGHKQPEEDDSDRIGRFGVGFKTGAMRLGKDALVLTQTTKSRSIAFLSQSLNKGKDNVEIPIVTYCLQAQCMEIDTAAQSKELASYNLGAIKDNSPFNEYLIGAKTALFKSNTGTQIYIWNLDKWGSDYSLDWEAGDPERSSFYHGDIYIRSRRVRSRPGQTSQQVPLDYSLRAYLEVLFLEPRMKIYLQGALVRSRPLDKSLNQTVEEIGEVMGKPVRLTLGRCQLEWEQANCGMFLYWHNRLIEAYKRVGGMIHSADMGRGVLGVIDVTELMDDGNGGVWVHSNKQGFQDCEPYALLEEWLGKMADKYWDNHFDALQLKKKNTLYKPDHEWVQCDKCRKWRMLDETFDSSQLTGEWFCYMAPFKGTCDMPEKKAESGVITVGTKRSGCYSVAVDCTEDAQTDDSSPGDEEDSSDKTYEEDVVPPVNTVMKRLRRGPARASKKK